MFIDDLFKDACVFVGTTLGKLAREYDVTKADAKTAKFSFIKKDASLKIVSRTEGGRVLTLEQKDFQNYGICPVFLSYASPDLDLRYKIPPPDNVKAENSVPFDFRVDDHGSGKFTTKVNKRGYGRLEIDVDAELEKINNVRAYDKSGFKFYEQRFWYISNKTKFFPKFS